MIDFDYKGIRIDATTESIQHDYTDANHHKKTRFERQTLVFFHFWDFTIWNGNLTELTFIKAILQIFMHKCKTKGTKEGCKIDLVKALHHNRRQEGQQSLWFIARQKDKKPYLHICLQAEGNTINEVFFDDLEVTLLDIALSKTINLLTPNNIDRG